ncbi:MAG: hypothetical protein A2511_16510 [Deltaproteobacteria bacterium RIFOXYD12_FULL_50_9]|nr:MAG: hypothetical protein A2511_16510 [Deltaproteobacteria bacterium RIFOXYD12_FULL_50_9]
MVTLLLKLIMGMTFIETVLLDSGLHVILLLLPLYYLLYKPLQVRTHVAETAQNELTTLSLNLEQIVNERSSDLIKEINLSHNHEQSLRERENELERSLLTQAIFNKLLFLSLENLPLNDSLERFLNLISSFPWFELQPKGAVFLKDPGSDHLLMICQRDLAPALLNHCARVPYGTCLCGLAAKSGQVVYAENVDNRHHIQYDGMCNHGHYCVPIFSQNHEMLGVFTLYLKEGQKREPIIEETLLAAAGVVGNIIEHKLATELLRHERDRNQQYLDIMGTMMVALNSQGTITLINQFGASILEYDENELLGRNWFKTCVPAELSDEAERFFDNIMTGHFESFKIYENQIVTATGNKRLLLFRNALIHDDSGKVTGLLFAGTDITERKAAEQEREALQNQLRQAQKMEAIGTLAGGIAHDFNNILTAILGYAEMAQDEISTDSVVHEDMEQVIVASKRARDLIKHILAFSRQVEQNRIPMLMAPILKEAIKLLRASIPANIVIKQAIYQESGSVLADPVQIHQILMNLCTNAVHAMEEKGGTLEIRLEDVTLTEDDTYSLAEIKPGRYARLQVVDNGHGLNQETIKRIFDPYFTTKPVGKGTGLGLSVVHGIIKSYNGAIRVESERNHGSVFSIFIPIVEIAEDPASNTSQEIRGGNEKILVIDDEPTITHLIEKILNKLGYQVTTSNKSIEALKTFKTNQQAFDLIITDQAMPGLTGGDLAKEVLRIRPDMPIILCTGYSETLNEESAKRIGILEYILKPILKQDLALTVRKVLDNARKRLKPL